MLSTPKLCFISFAICLLSNLLLNRAFNPASQLSKLLLHSTPLLSLISSGKAPTFEQITGVPVSNASATTTPNVSIVLA